MPANDIPQLVARLREGATVLDEPYHHAALASAMNEAADTLVALQSPPPREAAHQCQPDCNHTPFNPPREAAPPDLVALRHAWEAGFRLCRNYGDNHHHWDGEQREQRWRGYLASVDAAWSPAPPVAETPHPASVIYFGPRGTLVERPDGSTAWVTGEEAAQARFATSPIKPASPGVAPAPEERSPYDSGLCCMARHASAKPPWTCDCPCHTALAPETQP